MITHDNIPGRAGHAPPAGETARNAQPHPAPQGIDRNVALKRALWTLAEEMRRLKAA